MLVNSYIKENELKNEDSEENLPEIKHNSYCGKLLLREIAILDQVETKSSRIAMISVMIRTLIYIGYLGINYKDIVSFTYSDYIILMCLIFLGMTMHMVNLIFVVIGVVDFRRKLFFQKWMSCLLSPERRMNSPAYAKLIPTIDIFDSDNLRRWMTLRKVSLDLGKKFTYRVFMYSSIFLVLYGTIAVFFTLTFFDLLPYNIPFQVMVLGYFDIFVILGVLMYMLNTGAHVNSYFAKHKTILLGIKRRMMDVGLRFDVLKNKRSYNCDTLKALVEKSKEKWWSSEEVKEKTEEWIGVIDINMEVLEHDSENEALKLIGFKCTYELMNSIYSGLFTLLLASGQYIYNQIMK
jgi:hypothetical protein